MKFVNTALLVVALSYGSSSVLALPVDAAEIVTRSIVQPSVFSARDGNVDLEAREPKFNPMKILSFFIRRGIDESADLAAREEELDAREPKFNPMKILSFFIRRDEATDLAAREEELDAREPKFNPMKILSFFIRRDLDQFTDLAVREEDLQI